MIANVRIFHFILNLNILLTNLYRFCLNRVSGPLEEIFEIIMIYQLIIAVKLYYLIIPTLFSFIVLSFLSFYLLMSCIVPSPLIS